MSPAEQQAQAAMDQCMFIASMAAFAELSARTCRPRYRADQEAEAARLTALSERWGRYAKDLRSGRVPARRVVTQTAGA